MFDGDLSRWSKGLLWCSELRDLLWCSKGSAITTCGDVRPSRANVLTWHLRIGSPGCGVPERCRRPAPVAQQTRCRKARLKRNKPKQEQTRSEISLRQYPVGFAARQAMRGTAAANGRRRPDSAGRTAPNGQRRTDSAERTAPAGQRRTDSAERTAPSGQRRWWQLTQIGRRRRAVAKTLYLPALFRPWAYFSGLRALFGDQARAPGPHFVQLSTN